LKKGGRYDVSGLAEAQYEPGSNDRVLRNLLGIVDPDEMDRVEARALVVNDYPNRATDDRRNGATKSCPRSDLGRG